MQRERIDWEGTKRTSEEIEMFYSRIGGWVTQVCPFVKIVWL